MEPQLVMLIVQVLLKYGPDVAESIVYALKKPESFTLEDWKAMLDKCRKNTKIFLAETEALDKKI